MNPTLQQVLTQGGNSAGWTLNIHSLLLAVAVFAFSVATYTLVRRNGFSKKTLPEFIEGRSENEDLERALLLNEKLNQEIEKLKGENKEFFSQVKNLEELGKMELVLRKSNISLTKECERLKKENEELTLKLNSLSIKPQPQEVKRVKTKKVKRKNGKAKN